MSISHSCIKFLCSDGIAGSISHEIFAEITGRVRLGIDNLVPAGADTDVVSVWHGPCQHWWQLGLTSSQNQPESFTASVTSSVCGEFVMGDCLSGSINRHRCPAPSPNGDISFLWCKYSLSTWRKSIFSHTDPILTRLEKLERLALPRRASVQEGEQNRQTWPSSSALLGCSLGILST